MILYVIYRNPNKKTVEQTKLQELSEHVVDVFKLSTMVCSELNSVVPQLSAIQNEDNEIVMMKKQTENV